jgi:hypothetical protein
MKIKNKEISVIYNVIIVKKIIKISLSININIKLYEKIILKYF